MAPAGPGPEPQPPASAWRRLDAMLASHVSANAISRLRVSCRSSSPNCYICTRTDTDTDTAIVMVDQIILGNPPRLIFILITASLPPPTYGHICTCAHCTSSILPSLPFKLRKSFQLMLWGTLESCIFYPPPPPPPPSTNRK